MKLVWLVGITQFCFLWRILYSHGVVVSKIGNNIALLCR